jgi:hypothetical protein
VTLAEIRFGIESMDDPTSFTIRGWSRRNPIVWEYRKGEDTETIRSHYPTLSLEQINGAIAFYLNHKDEVEHVMEERRRAEEAYTAAHPTPPEVKEKFARMRRQMASRRT